jgi:hypothetical protein
MSIFGFLFGDQQIHSFKLEKLAGCKNGGLLGTLY